MNPIARRARGERTYAFAYRRLPRGSIDAWVAFLRGEDRSALSSLVLALTEKPHARRDRAVVQADVDALDGFFRHEAHRLREACAKKFPKLEVWRRGSGARTVLT